MAGHECEPIQCCKLDDIFLGYMMHEVVLGQRASMDYFVESKLLDHQLIATLIECWRLETHTFHLLVGETTKTLQEFDVFWGLKVAIYLQINSSICLLQGHVFSFWGSNQVTMN